MSYNWKSYINRIERKVNSNIAINLFVNLILENDSIHSINVYIILYLKLVLQLESRLKKSWTPVVNSLLFNCPVTLTSHIIITSCSKQNIQATLQYIFR